ncbi:hypothetical protein TRFO_11104 [Tritrichomonas foetus]|uniref:Uncharacterized protein n=1 Tax=Tritrichomonas foetus TaxID=1144522 RepID=A0A1J4J5G3_9EUKA|nr:hypothetical protein TRFO_11104 [Tritrichomonas foetus]|eukprot:OHS94482.1 hypothetical protein TRFO_11104 [Tritrichomonas foetus]
MCALFFLLFSTMTASKDKEGFFEFSVKPGTPVEIDNILNYTILVSFFLCDPFAMHVNYFNEDDKMETLKFKTKGTFSFKCKKLIFTSIEKTQKISMWKIPDHLCHNSSILLQTENVLDANTENAVQQFPICIFTQLEGNHFFVTASTQQESTSGLSFYSKDIKEKKCYKNSNCDFHSLSPFFLRINGNEPENNFKLSLTYKINIKRAQKDNSCSMSSLPTVFHHGVSFLPSSFIGESTVVCTNLAQDTMNRIVSLIVTILVTVVVLFVIHCIGAINIFHLCHFDGHGGNESGYQQPGSADISGSLLE